jgi:hypothetical protein
MKKTGLMKGVVLFAVTALAGAATAGEESPDRWIFSAGPAWRSRVKSSISGRPSGGPSVPASRTVTYDKDIAGHGPWSRNEVVLVDDPDIPGSQRYAATRTGTERTVTPGSGATTLNDSDIDRPLGISISAGRDFYTSGRFAAGLALRFAGYWDMKSHACGQAGGGTVTSRSWKDYYLFNDGPFPNDTDFSYFYPDTEPYAPYHQDLGVTGRQTIPSERVCARFSSDLYQVGIGPRLAWWANDRVEVFGGIEALCNFARLDVECGEMRRTETECLPGVGARLGAVAYLTDNIGIQVEAGYEWVDEADVSLGGVRAEVDYSSFVLSAGLIARF